jgi:serine/threonine protein kinase
LFVPQPENVLLDTSENCVKLIDLGSAQQVGHCVSADVIAGLHQDGGTEFLAPEIISRGPIGTYSDMWAFGVLLYVCLRWVV